jgi:hypothetical protein
MVKITANGLKALQGIERAIFCQAAEAGGIGGRTARD